MAPFRFRLEQVLEYRRQLEDQAMQALALATKHRDAMRDHVEYLLAEIAAQREQLCRAAAFTAAERWVNQQYETALHDDLEQALQELAILEEEADRCRAELVTKAQERELLDKLKEKQAARHAREERLNEQRVYDETATLRFKPVSL